MQVLGNEDRFSRGCRWAVDSEEHFAADHEFGQLWRGCLRRYPGADRLTAPDDRDPVADGRDFAQLVRDEDDSAASLAQPPEDHVELVDLLGREERGRLVQDERPAALVEGP